MVGAPFTPALLFLPVSLFLLAAFTLGVGLWLSAVAVYFPDVLETYQIVLLAWMYLTPIIYPIDIIAESDRWLFSLNPLYPLLVIFRAPLFLRWQHPPRAIHSSSFAAPVTHMRPVSVCSAPSVARRRPINSIR